VKNWFQSLPFEFNLQRYTVGAAKLVAAAKVASKVGRYKLNSVDP
jgi:hypothetical protein